MFRITMEEQETSVTRERDQTRTTIPKKFVDKFKVTKRDKIKWNNRGGKLKGELNRDINDGESK